MVARFRTTSHDLAVEVGQVLASAEWKAHAQLARTALSDAEADALAERLTEARDQTLRRLDGVREHSRQRLAEHRTALEAAAVDAARRLCTDARQDRGAGRWPAPPASRDREAVAVDRRPAGAADAWRDRQIHLLKRSRLAQRLARFRNRLTAAAGRHLEDIVAGVHGSGLRACTTLRDALAARDAADPVPQVADELPYDPAPVVARLARAAAAMTGELPETETLLSDEAAAALVRGDAAIDTTTVPVRSSVQGLVETDLIGAARGRGHALRRGRRPGLGGRPRHRPAAGRAARARTTTSTSPRPTATAPARSTRPAGASTARSPTSPRSRPGSATPCSAGSRRSPPRPSSTAWAPRSRPAAPAAPAAAGRRACAPWPAAASPASATSPPARSTGAAPASSSPTRPRPRASRPPTTRSASWPGAPPPVPASSASLPLYYRNLFTGQININEAFFVGRADKVAAGAAVLDRRPRPAACARSWSAARAAPARPPCASRLRPPPAARSTGSAPRPAAPRAGPRSATALEAAVGTAGTPAQVAARLEPGSVIVVDDLDLWWERRPGGLEAIDEILELVEATGDDVGFVLAGGDAATRVLGQLRPLDRVADTHVGCQPLTARQLDQVIMARHASTGLRLKLPRRRSIPLAQGGLGPWARARLFDAYFDYSAGNVGYALRAWVAHIDGFDDGQLAIRQPQLLDWDALDDLRPDLIAVLVELVLHKHAERRQARSA